MARTVVPVTTLTANAALAEATGTSLDPSNGHYVTPGGREDDVFLYLDHTTASSKTVTIKAGSYPPAFRKGLGDLTITAAASTKYLIGPLESARFLQADGTINIDVQASTTGTLRVYKLPRAA